MKQIRMGSDLMERLSWNKNSIFDWYVLRKMLFGRKSSAIHLNRYKAFRDKTIPRRCSKKTTNRKLLKKRSTLSYDRVLLLLKVKPPIGFESCTAGILFCTVNPFIL